MAARSSEKNTVEDGDSLPLQSLVGCTCTNFLAWSFFQLLQHQYITWFLVHLYFLILLMPIKKNHFCQKFIFFILIFKVIVISSLLQIGIYLERDSVIFQFISLFDSAFCVAVSSINLPSLFWHLQGWAECAGELTALVEHLIQRYFQLLSKRFMNFSVFTSR